MWKFIRPRPGNLRIWQLGMLVLLFLLARDDTRRA
jgi:NitT/TauT family transport system permease protein